MWISMVRSGCETLLFGACQGASCRNIPISLTENRPVLPGWPSSGNSQLVQTPDYANNHIMNEDPGTRRIIRVHFAGVISTVSIYSDDNTSAVRRLEDVHECKSPSIRLCFPAAHTLHFRECSSFRAAEDGQRKPRPR